MESWPTTEPPISSRAHPRGHGRGDDRQPLRRHARRGRAAQGAPGLAGRRGVPVRGQRSAPFRAAGGQVSRFAVRWAFLGLAQGEGRALALLGEFAAALGQSEKNLMAYDPKPFAQAYPAYLAQRTAFGTAAEVALAMVADLEWSCPGWQRVKTRSRSPARPASCGLRDRLLGRARRGPALITRSSAPGASATRP